VNEPVVGRWYLNLGMPLSHTQRLYVFKIHHHLVHLTDDPRSLMPGEKPWTVIWEVDAFRDFFRACEDLSKAVVLGPCPKDCPMCFAPAITLAARRAIRAVNRENAHREWLKQQQRRARAHMRHQRAIMDQVIQTRKAR
jgi:hypothetical protein